MKDPFKLLQDMVDAITAIESYEIPSFDAFLGDEKTQDAVMFNLIVMGEAANKLPGEFQGAHPEIPWPSIIGTRNLIVHGYDQVKIPIVWDIIEKDMQPLRENLIKLMGGVSF
jgi:uncharacterized protein with HEPN domain